MKAFGYADIDIDAESPRQLNEVTFLLSTQEIDVLIGFLQHVKEIFKTSSPTQGESHSHLRDWWKKWEESGPDLVIVYQQLGKPSVHNQDKQSEVKE